LRATPPDEYRLEANAGGIPGRTPRPCVSLEAQLTVTITPLTAVFAALATASTLYWLYALGCVLRFRRQPRSVSTVLPPVTILKPLCGAHPGLYETLRSFCEQDYPHFQIVFGVRHAADPAVEIVQRLMNEHRALHLKLVVNDRDVGVNPKVSNLANAFESAEHDVLVIADSDIRVEPDYLRAIVAPLAEAGVGLVTCLYGSSAIGHGWGVLGRLFIDDWFFPSALVSATGGTLRHAFGATLAFHRQTLNAIGGFRALGAYLADDYTLGERIARIGRRVVLSSYVVQTRVVEASFRALFLHELRWFRTMRAVRPVGFFFAASTYGFVWSGLALAAGGAWTALTVAAVHAGVRVLVHRAVRAALSRPGAIQQGEGARLPTAWLLPARDLLSFALWAASFMGRTVRWGGHRFAVDRHGRIEPAP
jgi:ceramide glucosyltransferase